MSETIATTVTDNSGAPTAETGGADTVSTPTSQTAPVEQPATSPVEGQVTEPTTGGASAGTIITDPVGDEGNVSQQQEPPDPEDTVPEQYNFDEVIERNKEITYTDTDKGLVSDLGKELKLTSRQAKALLEKGGSVLNTYRKKALDNMSDSWVQEVQKDETLGGAHYKETQQNCAAALERFGNQRLRELLIKTKLGNNPDFVRFFNAVGKELREDNTFVSGSRPGKKDNMAWFYNNTPYMQ